MLTGRRTVRLAWIGLLGMAAAACASVEVPTEPVRATSLLAPPPMEDFDWHLILEEDLGQARLAFGPETSDWVLLGMGCTRGSHQLELMAYRPKLANQLRLEAGDLIDDFAVVAEEDPSGEGVFLVGKSQINKPVFQNFRSSRWISSWVDGERIAYVPHLGSEVRINRFFEYCG